MSWNFEYSAHTKEDLTNALEKRRCANFDGAVLEAVRSAIAVLPVNPAAIYSIKSHGHVDAHHGTAMIEVRMVAAEKGDDSHLT